MNENEVTKTQLVFCGFCGRPCGPTEDVGFMRFPRTHGELSPILKPAHLSHHGVKEEYERQMNAADDSKS